MNTPYRPSDFQDLYYVPRTAEFEDAALSRSFKPAVNDRTKICLINIDNQIDFVAPDGNLPVAGAVDDAKRLVEFIYGNLESITNITTSLDTHQLIHIFFPIWWRDSKGNTPDGKKATLITYDDVRKQVWRPAIDPKWSVDYVKKLGFMMVWPYHCIEGTTGHNLVPQLSEAITYHSIARYAIPETISKGRNHRTEHFGIFNAEVPDPNDTSTQLDPNTLRLIAQNDLIYVAGQAKSHCVLNSMKQMVSYFEQYQPEAIKKVRFLMDCTSSVVAPGVDFESIANDELSKMAAKGVQLVKSTDPIR